MKTILITALILVGFTITSCNKNNEPEPADICEVLQAEYDEVYKELHELQTKIIKQEITYQQAKPRIDELEALAEKTQEQMVENDCI
jgi:uncharacterized membrane protein YukC